MTDLKNSHAVRKMARISGKPGQASVLREALMTLEKATKTEEGCLDFSFYQALSAEDSFILLEHFANEEALKIHMQLPHTQSFFKKQLTEGIQAVDIPSLDM
jgi:quinol monooxygenase YgiN